MDIGNISASLFRATSAASASPKNAAPSAEKADAGSASSSDKLDFSDLASALKGDALDLFNNLSKDDRATLAGYVSKGAISGEDLNDALSGALKSARKSAFWQGADGKSEGNSASHPSFDVDLSRITAIERQRETMHASGLSGAQILSAVDGGRVGGTGSPVGHETFQAFSLRGDDPRFFASAKEQAAGAKFAALGFRSDSFDTALSGLAQDFAQGYLAGDGRSTISLGRAS